MRALISVSDKTGVVEFAKGLVALGYEIISTGGTAKVLAENGVTVIAIDTVTEFPEMMNGRVKTLHPKIHGGLLALRDNDSHMQSCRDHNITPIDMVVVNLYPFKQTVEKPGVSLEEAIENIDIGGPSMIRSASKNYRSVGVIVNPERYIPLLSELSANKGQLSDSTRADLALDAFTHTAEYDSMISKYLQKTFKKDQGEDNRFPETVSLTLHKESALRYGENPHQSAAFYKIDGTGTGIADYVQHHGKELSYNNLVDLESAWHIVREFKIPAATVIKHTNPCGTAIGTSIEEAYQKAHDADPVSAFGSIIGLNKAVNKTTADAISKTFVEAVIAPSFDTDAIEILTQKPSIRLITLPNFQEQDTGLIHKYVQGGFLLQEPDNCVIKDSERQVVTSISPSNEDNQNLDLAFTLCKHVKSNAIVLVNNGVTVGVGAGQMSRVEAVEIAIKKAGDLAKGAVCASDAFFPFRDSVDLLSKAGVKAVIQPGGSKRDEESVEACNNSGLSMTMTGIRHFKH